MSQRTVIVTDGDQRAALGVVRSLGRAGYRCVVVSPSGRSIAGASRFAAREASAQDPLRAPEAFAEAIVALARAERAALVVPLAEPAMLSLLGVRDRLGPSIIPFPSLQTFRALSDKQRLLEEAAAVGIAVPEQFVLPCAGSVPDLDLESVHYPVVLKPARSVGEHAGTRHKLGVTYAADPRELRQKLAAMPAAAYPLLLQQRIVGPGIGIFLLLWDGAERARFAHRRLVEKPPSGGVSVYRESVPVDAELLARSRALLDRFGWYGVAMVEFKQDAASGRPYLMEINGRFWGSLQLAVDAGVDFPRLLAACALGQPEPPVTCFRVGVRSRWLWGEVDHLIARMHAPNGSGPLPPGTVARRRVLWDILSGPFRPGDYEEVLRWSDPAPFWRETTQWMRAL